MSQHGWPERLSNRCKGYQEECTTQPTMEVLVETLTGTAFEMTVSPSDTIHAIKSKIFRVEGIPISQQHLLYNLKELEDSSSLGEHAISDGARLRLVLGMRGGPISTRRVPPPPNVEPWRDIERLLDSNREEGSWGGSGSGCKMTVLVIRDGERVNMLRVRENNDGTYSPLDNAKYGGGGGGGSGNSGGASALHDNALTMAKMLQLRRRMHARRTAPQHTGEKAEIQKTRSEETLSVPSLLYESTVEPFKNRIHPYNEAEDTFGPLYDGNYTRYDYDCSFADRYTLLPPIGTRTDSDQSVQEAADNERLKLSDALAGSILVKGGRRDNDEAAILEECLDSGVEECHIRQDSPQLSAKNLAPIPTAEYGPLVIGSGGAWRAWSHSASSLVARPALSDALFSSSTSDLEQLKRNTNRILPALSRHRNREHLHLSDEGLDLSHRPRNLEVGSERRQRRIDKINELERERLFHYGDPPRRQDKEQTSELNVSRAVARPDRSELLGERSELLGKSSEFLQQCTDLISTELARAELDRQRAESRKRSELIAQTPEIAENCLETSSTQTEPAPSPEKTEDVPEKVEKERKIRIRCGFCRKRLSIATVHKCRCGAQFCAAHRYAEVHGCAYDYKASANQYLQRANPLVAPKLPKI